MDLTYGTNIIYCTVIQIIPSFTTTTAQVDVNFMHATSHYALVPGNVISENGTLIPITIMFDVGSGISLVASSLFERANYECQLEYELTLRWATDVTHTYSNTKLFSLKFVQQDRNKAVTIRNLSTVNDSKLPEQCNLEQAANFKQQCRFLIDVLLPSYPRQVPQILLGLSHAGLMAQLSIITSGNTENPVAA